MALFKLLANIIFCREVYGRSGLQRLYTDECVFVRYVSNIKGQPQLTNEDLLINGKFLTWNLCPTKCESTNHALIQWLR